MRCPVEEENIQDLEGNFPRPEISRREPGIQETKSAKSGRLWTFPQEPLDQYKLLRFEHFKQGNKNEIAKNPFKNI